MRLLSIVILPLLASAAFSQVLFQEQFTDIDAFSNVNNAKILSGSLDINYNQESGNRLQIKDIVGNDISYNLGGNIADPATRQTIYITYYYRAVTTEVNSKFSGLILYDNGREVFGMGNDSYSQRYSFWDGSGSGINIGMVPTEVDDKVHQFVARIDCNPNGPETVTVWLDPNLKRSESRQSNGIATTREIEVNFNEFRLRCGEKDCICEFDEIRITTDWDSLFVRNDQADEYFTNLIKDSKPAGSDEMIGEKIARFYPAGTDKSKLPKSLLLKDTPKSIGKVPSSWKLHPEFGLSQGKRYAYINISPEVDLYGTGEVTGSLLRNGKKIVLYNKDNGGYHRRDQLYQSHPWVMGVRPDGSTFGVIFDSTWKAELDLREGILFTVDAKANDIPVIIIEGQMPQEVMTKLADLTGTMEMPPRWALGYQQCRWSYNPDSRVRQIADTFRAKQIPCDVIWMDIDYMDGFRIFTFSNNEFPDPDGLSNYLHAQGFKGVWMIDPGVKYEDGYFVYEAGCEKDAWIQKPDGQVYVGPVWPGDCVFPDFTIPAVRTWWSQLYKDFMARGVDGVWNDMNEPAVFNTPEITMPEDNVHRGGDGLPAGPHQQYHNVYGFLMVKATQAGIKKANPNKRPFVLSRANYLGGHRYAATWTGDNVACWEHLEWSIPMSLNLSLSGQSFNGPDIGGFAGNASPELWSNWISTGAFYPFCRAHSGKGSLDQEPWAFGQKAENTSRIALQRRYRLMPYIYTLFRQTHMEGLPVMRPVFFADPADLSLRTEDQAFMVGSDLMVVPKWATSVKQPKGIWQSVSIVPGDTDDPSQCDLKVRGGAIVPMGPVAQCTEEMDPQAKLTLIVVPDENGNAAGTLYEDSGDGYDYKNQEFGLSTFKAQTVDDKLVVKCTQQQGKWKSDKRLVSVSVVTDNRTYHGYGDIISGVSVQMK